MKNILFIFLCFISTQILAQNPFQNSTVQVNGQIYDCDNSNSKLIRVVNKQNQASQPWHTENIAFARARFAPQENYVSPLTTIKNLFTNERLAQLRQSDKFFSVSYVLNLDGSVKEVWFRLKKNTQITPLELYNIEQALQKLKFNVRQIITEGIQYKYYAFSHTFEF